MVLAEDADSVINTKHIITSIVNAANKKLKLRQQSKSAESLNCDRSFGDSSCAVGPPAVRSFSVSDTVECGVYRERNVDKAIARAAASSMSQGSLVSSLRSGACLWYLLPICVDASIYGV